jgi:hypothetical protein
VEGGDVKMIFTLLTGATVGIASVSAYADAPVQASCKLKSVGNKIQRVVHITFVTRDNRNVPSDLEQKPLNFLQNNGVVSGNHHTPLISHTAYDITTALTGVYGARSDIPVANSHGFFRPDGSVGLQSSFSTGRRLRRMAIRKWSTNWASNQLIPPGQGLAGL